MKKKILIIDDEKSIRVLLKNYLQKDYEVTAKENGEEGMAWLQQGNLPDLIVADIQMPKMDGYEATRKIREYEKETGKHIPIVAMTAHAMKGDKEKCLAAGMDQYLAKPLDTNEVVKIIREYTS